MNLQLLMPGETPPTPEAMNSRALSALAVASGDELPPRAPGISLYSVFDLSNPADCPNDPSVTQRQTASLKSIIHREVDGVLLNAPDAWYRGAADQPCASCDTALGKSLSEEYGAQLQPIRTFPAAVPNDPEGAMFWRERAAMRLRASITQSARMRDIVRDETRSAHESGMQIGARFLGVSAPAVSLATRLDFAVLDAPKPDTTDFGVGPYEVFRAALDQRSLSAIAPHAVAAKPALVLQAARLASSVGTELALPASAPAESHLALAAHRNVWREFRSRYRPAERLTEVLLVYSAPSDHWSKGRHGAAVVALAEALTRSNVQYRVVLAVPRTGTEPLILAECATLDAEDAARVERRVTEGASAIVLGACGTGDEFGRPLTGPFAELVAGLNRVGSGSVIQLEFGANETADTLLPPLEKALESLLGRSRRAVSASRSGMMVKMFLDPDRKLDVHLVGRQFDPATGAAEHVKGLTLHLSGSAVSGARTGYLFAMEETERKVPLTAFGMGVQAVIPDFRGAAILTITR